MCLNEAKDFERVLYSIDSATVITLIVSSCSTNQALSTYGSDTMIRNQYRPIVMNLPGSDMLATRI